MENMHIITFLVVVSTAFILLVCDSKADVVCETTDKRMTCQYDIPKKIPPGVTEVYVENHKDINLSRNSFSDPRWKHILILQIYQNKAKTHSIQVHDSAFRELDSLSVFGIHTRGFSIGDRHRSNIFRGLENITELDFSGCVNLNSSFVALSLMQDGEFTKLRTLNLNEVNTNTGSRNINFSQLFIDMLVNKRIKNLSLRKTMIHFQPFIQKSVSEVTRFDLSDTSYSLSYRFSSPDDVFVPLLRLFGNTKLLNITNFKMFDTFWRGDRLRFTNLHCTDCTELCGVYIFNLLFVEYIYANNMLVDTGFPIEIINSTFNFTCRMNLKVVELRENNVRRIQGTTFHWPDQNFLRYLDLTGNKMSFLSSSVTSGLTNLTTFVLGENRLSDMSSSPEFINLFANCLNLEKLVLDRNGLSYLPESIFLRNKMLTYLTLKGNLLRKVTFNTKHLKYLQHLDLSDNLIHILDEQSMNNLNDVIHFQTYSNINLEGNPIECSCNSAPFIKWIQKHSVYMPHRGIMLNCTIEGRIVGIDDKTVAKTQFMCIRILVYVSIALAVVFAIAASTVVSIAVPKLIKRRRKNDQVRRFLQKYQNNQIKENFLCLLSYFNTDSTVAIEHIYKNMNETLKEITGPESDSVCIVERHFRAGAEIVAEIMRFVSESCVIVFIVSKSFCQSSWCCLEIKEAYEQQKPIVLIFCEEVDENEMPAHLKQMFQRCTRAKLVKQDEEFTVQPGGWEGLCDSIIHLASRQCAEELE
ncbi:toll-like receptor 8 [Mercenaria mercenaria]|uniref:toll-like receptor 8 n=1 Tax=Mercenaria mercenaria TaxID=6596 RepID=UPI00234F04AB|nr:toll-like receptor 8 [Mercenaria mercenaria]